uniref:phosphoinositide 5-phosphatase n=1 Tax=Camelus bactrianus TaxID=9837 RepID=A0A9W3GCA0_CAMBA|nr:type II inositol 1,4,5-trisphosphate 5-phosphatase isoform X4 [Camelus bactrianus]
MDQSVAIQETLAEEEYCIIAVQGVLCEGDSRQSRLLGLVRYRPEGGGQEHALFLYTHRRMAITGDDVSLDQIVPISRDFTLEEVSPEGELYILGSDVTVQLDTAELSLVFHLPFGSHTRMFLQEVSRAHPGLDPATPDPEFLWLSRYRCARREPEPPATRVWNSAPGTWPGSARIGGGRVHSPRQSLPWRENWCVCIGAAWLSCKSSAALRDWAVHRPGVQKSLVHPGTGGHDEVTGSSSFDDSKPNGKGLLVDQSSRGQDKPENLLPRQNKSKSEITDMVRSSTITVSDKAHILSVQKFGLRDTIVKSQLMQKEEDYTYIQSFRFFVGTYNVNGQSPKECLRPWLSDGIQAPDVYCVGFQELDLSKEAFFFHDTPKEEEWFKAVSDSLHPDAKYAKVKLIRLVGIMLLLYVKQEHAAHISEVEAETVGTGIMGRMGNKGGVAIRFQFHNTSICVVNSHLAAHTEEYERRNQDYKDICSRMQFCQLDPSLPPLTISKHDVILWLGDLNYRIEELDVEKVKKLIEEKAFQTLYAYDQLRAQVAAKAVFEGFEEGELTFQPTYKYDTGSNDWDTSEKCRAPAWCDRVLWKGKNITQLSYQSHMALKTSDHKPVSSVFDIGVRVVNEELYRKTLEEIVRSLDKLENASIPSVSLSKRETLMQLHTEDDGSQLEKSMEIPKELWMMVDYLYRNAVQQEDLFQQPGLRWEFEHIRDCLDTGTIDTLSASNHSVAEALLLFLESLPEPVICYSAYRTCLECSGNLTASKQVITTLPACHRNVFTYLMAFLQELLKNSTKNHLDDNILASIFGSLLLRNPAGDQKLEMAEKKKAQEFIHQFLCNSP